MHTITPLNLAGNTTDEQNAELKALLAQVASAAYQKVIGELDQESARTVLESIRRLEGQLKDYLVDVVHRNAISNKWKEEEVDSRRCYPSLYRVHSIEAQVTELRKYFPQLHGCMEKIAYRELPEGGPEEWFAIPRWQVVAPTYNEALELVLSCLASKRKFVNRIFERMGPAHLRPGKRAKLAEEFLASQQQGNDIFVVAAQFGMLHRGCSARRARTAMAGNEFGLGAFAVACMLITHPQRMCNQDALMIDCGGDEYSARGGDMYDRVPLFDYDISGLQFSIFYNDRSRDVWGTPSGFLYKIS